MKQWDVKDVDAGAALSANVKNFAGDVQTLCANLRTKAEECDTLDGTFQMNEQVASYLREIAGHLDKLPETLEEVAKIMDASVAAAISANDAAANGALF